MEPAVYDEVEGAGLIVDVFLVLFQEARLVVGVEGHVFPLVRRIAAEGGQHADDDVRVDLHRFQYGLNVFLPFFRRQGVFHVGQVDVSRF